MEWAAQRALSDERRRYTIRKVIRYTAAGVFGLSVIEIWVQWLQGLLLILGATSAGLAIALAPVIVSIAGWFLITSSNLYKVGDRVQLGGVIGDVTDVGILRTSLLEIGNWVAADQLSGRVVTVTNAAVFKDPSLQLHTGGSLYLGRIHRTDFVRTSLGTGAVNDPWRRRRPYSGDCGVREKRAATIARHVLHRIA